MTIPRHTRRRAGLPFVFIALAMLASCSSPSPGSLSGNDGDELAQVRALGVAYLAEALSDEAPGLAVSDLREKLASIDDLKMGHIRFQQTFRGTPVFQGEVIAHLNADASLRAITDTLIRGVRDDLSTEPLISAELAVVAATDAYSCARCLTKEPTADLWVLRHEGQDFLTYRVQLHAEDGIRQAEMPVVFVDAHTGYVVWAYDNLQTGTGASLYSGSVSFDTYLKDGTYYLESPADAFGTFEMRNEGNVTTYRYSDVNDIWSSSVQAPGVDVHYGTGKFLEYLSTAHSRNGLDGNGGPRNMLSVDGVTTLITSKARYNVNWCNASWNGSFMAYGNGSGNGCGPMVSLDAVGHEMTHAMTMYSAGLVYAGQSGALNESWSDVFGALLEHYVQGPSPNNWLWGEQWLTPNVPGDAARYFITPHQATNGGYTADDDPDHYSERYLGTADNGGVHINSGIANKVFSLVAAGGAHHLGGNMAGIGVEPAGRIWYRALTTYMTSGTNFAGARAATLNAAADIFGVSSSQRVAVATAWTMCGVN